MRELFDIQREAKAATAEAIESLSGVSEAAKILGVASSTLTKYASPAEEWRSNIIRFDLAIALDRASAHPVMLSSMQRLVAVSSPPPAGQLTAGSILRLGLILDEVVAEAARAIEDGNVDARERLAIRNRIVAAQQKLALIGRMAGAMP